MSSEGRPELPRASRVRTGVYAARRMATTPLTTLRDSQAPSADETHQPRIQVVIKGGGVKTLPLPRAGSCVLGRGGDWRPADNPRTIDHPSISRRHAAVHLGKTIEVEDLQSTNGTWVRGQRLPPETRVTLQPGEVFTLGKEIVCLVEAPQEFRHLTSVWTYGYFRDRLTLECQSGARADREFAVLHLDAGERDPHGFVTGLLDAVNPGDVVALDTPGQFLILRLRSTAAGARLFARDLKEGLGAARVGVAAYPDDGRDADALITAARDISPESAPAVVASDESALVVADPKLQELHALARDLARERVNVLLLGETGVGKEVFARRLHDLSGAKGRFVAVNCGALSPNLVEALLFGHQKGAFTDAKADAPGFFEAAHEGTLFLDEVGELPLDVQVKLLRALESRKFDRVGESRQERTLTARILSATNRNLDVEVAANRFRADLYFRLDVFSLTLPPLRARPTDIERMAREFARQVGARRAPPTEPEVSDEVMEIFLRYDWPGNIRELRNVIERGVVLARGGMITPQHLPERVLQGARASAELSSRPKPLPEPLEGDLIATIAAPLVADLGDHKTVDLTAFLDQVRDGVDRACVVKALEVSRWNQTTAAKRLGGSRVTLIAKMKKYGLAQPEEPLAR